VLAFEALLSDPADFLGANLAFAARLFFAVMLAMQKESTHLTQSYIAGFRCTCRALNYTACISLQTSG
jgi:hypothetical protein